MKEPVWIDATDVYAFQQGMLAMFGGLAGVRDGQHKKPPIPRWKQTGRLHDRRPVSGSERPAVLGAPEEEVVLQTLALAAGEIDQDAYAAWLKASCTDR